MLLNFQDIQSLLADAKAIFGAEFDKLQGELKWQLIAMLVSNSAITTEFGHLGEFPKMREWVGDKQIKDMRAYNYSLTTVEYESTVSIKARKMREAERNRGDRSLSVALGMPEIMKARALAAALWREELTFLALLAGDVDLCFDGQPYFDTAHPNGDQSTFSNEDESGAVDPWYILDSRVSPLMFVEHRAPELIEQTDPNSSDAVFMRGDWRFGIEADGTVGYTIPQVAFRNTATVSAGEIDTVKETMAEYVDDQDNPLHVRPDTIVYGPSNAAAIEEIVLQDRIGSGDSNNRFFGRFKLIESPYL